MDVTAPVAPAVESTTTAEVNGSAEVAKPAQVIPEAPRAIAEESKERIGADRFAALTRKEQQIVAKQREIAAARAEIEKQRAEVAEFHEMRRQAKLNPTKALEGLGLTYEDVTSYVLNDSKPTQDAHVAAVREEIEALRQEQQEREEMRSKQEAEALRRQEAETINAWRSGVADAVRAGGERYELTNLYGEHNLVTEVIEEHFAKTHRIMETEEAAALVEQHLEELAAKSLETKKFKARLAPKPAPVVKGDGTLAGQPIAQPRTISNEMSASTPSIMKSASTEKDRIARAMAALDGGRK